MLLSVHVPFCDSLGATIAGTSSSMRSRHFWKPLLPSIRPIHSILFDT